MIVKPWILNIIKYYFKNYFWKKSWNYFLDAVYLNLYTLVQRLALFQIFANLVNYISITAWIAEGKGRTMYVVWLPNNNYGMVEQNNLKK